MDATPESYPATASCLDGFNLVEESDGPASVPTRCEKREVLDATADCASYGTPVMVSASGRRCVTGGEHTTHPTVTCPANGGWNMVDGQCQKTIQVEQTRTTVDRVQYEVTETVRVPPYTAQVRIPPYRETVRVAPWTAQVRIPPYRETVRVPPYTETVTQTYPRRQRYCAQYDTEFGSGCSRWAYRTVTETVTETVDVYHYEQREVYYYQTVDAYHYEQREVYNYQPVEAYNYETQTRLECCRSVIREETVIVDRVETLSPADLVRTCPATYALDSNTNHCKRPAGTYLGNGTPRCNGSIWTLNSSDWKCSRVLPGVVRYSCNEGDTEITPTTTPPTCRTHVCPSDYLLDSASQTPTCARQVCVSGYELDLSASPPNCFRYVCPAEYGLVQSSDPPLCESVDPPHTRCVDVDDGLITTLAVGQDCPPCPAGFNRALRPQADRQRAMECVPDCGTGEIENMAGTGCARIACTPDGDGHARTHAPNGDCVLPCDTESETMDFVGACVARSGNEIPPEWERLLGTGLGSAACDLVDSARVASEAVPEMGSWWRRLQQAGVDALVIYCEPGVDTVTASLLDGDLTLAEAREISEGVFVSTLCGLLQSRLIAGTRLATSVTPAGLIGNTIMLVSCTEVGTKAIRWAIDAVMVPPSADCTREWSTLDLLTWGPRLGLLWNCPNPSLSRSNTDPSFTSATAFELAENQTAVATIVAMDRDSLDDVTGLSIVGGADQSKFMINSAGKLSFKVAPDFENPEDQASVTPINADQNNEYVVVIRATSGTGARQRTADQTITITVTDVNEPLSVDEQESAQNVPPTFTTVATFDVNENETMAAWVAAIDSDAQDRLDHIAIIGGADQSRFGILVLPGVAFLSFREAPDYENPVDSNSDNRYEVRVRATSGAGSRIMTAEMTIIVTITDVPSA